MLKKEAKEITGGLSAPSKMPGPAYNLPASQCITGSKLAKVAGTVCHGCYALKGRYRFSNVQAALQRRAASVGHYLWVKAMSVLVKREPWFRWHDSGDIQSAIEQAIASGRPAVVDVVTDQLNSEAPVPWAP